MKRTLRVSFLAFALIPVFFTLSRVSARAEAGVVEQMFDMSANPGPADLIKAARDGDVGRMELIIQRGANPNGHDGQGRTALHWAAEGGHADTAAELVRLGADPNARDYNLQTPLHLAAQRGHQMMVERLLQLGARPREMDDKNRTAADLAANGSVALRLLQAMNSEIAFHQDPVTHVRLKVGLLSLIVIPAGLALIILVLMLARRRPAHPAKNGPSDGEALERIMAGLDKMERRTGNLEEILLREDERAQKEMP